MTVSSYCCALLLLLCCWSRVSGLVFDPISPTIVSVTSPSCTVVESNTTRTASQCTANLANVLLHLKGSDWNGILEIPLLILYTPLNGFHYMNCEQDQDSGVVTVGHEAWEVSCILSRNSPLAWYEQQGVLALQIQDPPYWDPSPMFFGLTTATPAQTTALPVLYSIVGCMFDCRLQDIVTITGINFAGSPKVMATSYFNRNYYLTVLSSNRTQLVCQLPSFVTASDLDYGMSIAVFAGSPEQGSLNTAYLVIESPKVYPVVLGVLGCPVDDVRARTTSQCVGRVDTVVVQGRGWSSDLTGFSLLLTSPIGLTYQCVTLTLQDTQSGSDSFNAVCLLPTCSAGETYGMWQVATQDDQNGVSVAYSGLSYARISFEEDTAPLVTRVYCTSGCYSGDVLAVEGLRLASAAVTLSPTVNYYDHACDTIAQSDSRITCVLPYLPDAAAGESVGLRMYIGDADGYGKGDAGFVTVTQSPPVPRITGIYSIANDCSTDSSGMAVQGCQAWSRIWVKSEGWTADVDDEGAQVVLVTPIGRETACPYLYSNFSTTTGVMFVMCFVPPVSWQETFLPHSVAITAPDSTDTWYWSNAATDAVRYNRSAVPLAALALPAVYGVSLDCPTVSNVSYCTSDNTMTITGARLASPVTAVLASTYSVICERLVGNTVVRCQLPTIRPVDVGLVLEVDIYTSAGRAPTAYPPILTYAASAAYVPSGVPIPAGPSSTAAPRVPSSSSSSSSSPAARAASSSSSSSSVARPVTSSSFTGTTPPINRASSSSSSSSSLISRLSSSSSLSPSIRSTAAVTSSSVPVRASSTAAPSTARPSITSSRSSSSSSSTGSVAVRSSSSVIVIPIRSSSTGRVGSSSSSSSSTGSDSSNSDSAVSPSGGMSGGAVAGIVIVVLLVVLGGVAGGVCWMYGCPSWLRSRRSGPRSVDELLSMPDSSMDGEGGGGYVPPNYATNAMNGASGGAAASYQPPNAAASGGSTSYSNPYLPPSMRSSMLPSSGRPASDSAPYVPPARYVPPNAPSRASIFFHSSPTVHGSVDNTDGYAGHTSDDY